MDFGAALQGKLPYAVNTIVGVCAQNVRASIGKGESFANQLQRS